MYFKIIKITLFKPLCFKIIQMIYCRTQVIQYNIIFKQCILSWDIFLFFQGIKSRMVWETSCYSANIRLDIGIATFLSKICWCPLIGLVC